MPFLSSLARHRWTPLLVSAGAIAALSVSLTQLPLGNPTTGELLSAKAQATSNQDPPRRGDERRG